MDPDATLTEAIEAARDVLDPLSGDEDFAAQRATDLAERVVALDEWLRRGGFLPAAWNSNSSPKEG